MRSDPKTIAEADAQYRYWQKLKPKTQDPSTGPETGLLHFQAGKAPMFFDHPHEIRRLMATTLSHCPIKVQSALVHKNRVHLYLNRDPKMDEQPYLVFVDGQVLPGPGVAQAIAVNRRLIELAHACELIESIPTFSGSETEILMAQGRLLASLEDEDFVYFTT